MIARRTRIAGALLAAAALSGPAAGARAQVSAIEAATQDEIADVTQLDADMSSLAVAVGSCVQDGGGSAICLCAARPALAALGARAAQAMARRPDWAAPGAVVVWRNGLTARSLSVAGVQAEAARTLGACAD